MEHDSACECMVMHEPPLTRCFSLMGGAFPENLAQH